jgi:hypothetical protein
VIKGENRTSPYQTSDVTLDKFSAMARKSCASFSLKTIGDLCHFEGKHPDWRGPSRNGRTIADIAATASRSMHLGIDRWAKVANEGVDFEVLIEACSQSPPQAI